MVIGHIQKGASDGHATDGSTTLDAATRPGTGARPRPAPGCARAVRRRTEGCRRDERACRRSPWPVEAARSRYRLRLGESLSGRWGTDSWESLGEDGADTS